MSSMKFLRRNMGRYMRKAKTTADTAVVEMSQSSVGVRTRAKTLALQSTTENPASCYLELRSRRLEKQPAPQQQHNSQKGRRCKGQEQSEDRTREATLFSCSIAEIEASSFGENNFDAEASWDRSSRESTPSSSTSRAAATPSSSIKQTHLRTPSQRVPLNAVFVNMPTPLELDDFFAIEEQYMQRHFIEKYNFDFVNESPLSGRYEWVKVSP